MAKNDAFFSGTDTNPIIISIRGKIPRLQESVTSPKKGKNGICTYQIFKFLSKEGSSDMGWFWAKIVAKQLHITKYAKSKCNKKQIQIKPWKNKDKSQKMGFFIVFRDKKRKKLAICFFVWYDFGGFVYPF